MIIAVTGGTGFIGNKLVRALSARGHEVRVLTRSVSPVQNPTDSVKYFAGDLVRGDGLLPFLDGAEVVYHCAGQLTDETSMRALHVDGTRKLVEAASGRIRHWVQLSSVGVYGPVSEGEITEASPIRPAGEYEVTKAESDDIVLNASSQGKFSCSVLRPSNVFGAGMTNQSLFGMINMIDRGLFFFIGPRGAMANYIHVDNVVDALQLCAGASLPESGRVYIVSDHRPLEIFVDTIATSLGKKPPHIRLPEMPVRLLATACGRLPGFPLKTSRVEALTNRTVYRTDRIEAELGYHSRISMEAGLAELVEYWKHTMN